MNYSATNPSLSCIRCNKTRQFLPDGMDHSNDCFLMMISLYQAFLIRVSLLLRWQATGVFAALRKSTCWARLGSWSKPTEAQTRERKRAAYSQGNAW